MRQPQRLQALKSLGLEFWLPLPLLAIIFWLGCGWVTNRILSRSYDPGAKLEANTQLSGQPSKVLLAIKVEIRENQGFSKVRVKTANSALKELEFEFPMTEVSQIETAISQELGLPPQQIKQLVRYHIDYRN